MRRLLASVAVVIVGFGAIALGPAMLRRDVLRFEVRGTLGTGTLLEPIGVAYADGRLYVSDAGHNRIVVFDTTGAVLDSWGDPSLELRRPMHLGWSREGQLLVPEYLADRISVVERDGELTRRVGGRTGSEPGQIDAPGGVATAAGSLFIADFYNHRVDVLGGGSPATIGRPGRVRSGRLHYPTDVATGGDSLVYVADAYNHRIQVFTSDGVFVRKWGGPLGLGGRGALKGWFRVATGIEVTRDTVYVADFENDRIQIFTARGQYLGQATDSLSRPTDVAVGGRGELYVVDFGHDRVVRLERSSDTVP